MKLISGKNHLSKFKVGDIVRNLNYDNLDWAHPYKILRKEENNVVIKQIRRKVKEQIINLNSYLGEGWMLNKQWLKQKRKTHVYNGRWFKREIDKK